ncbi:SPFH domain-containing protein [Spongiibacter tropicus]|uniref:SPFH domain-containing protein n=1 Tax=Spongiibacter tropicus TaxID=454602 RepID=UPI0023573C2C|nr:SPFH domain-containing protein [Spongiibacter tropicus]|tara:strand:- start:38041 stop:39057 length:1017 start_codon:yes stop_codon:yes gene_type:complete
MLGIQYFKANPTVHVIQSSSGKIKRQGKGLSFFYYAPKTSLTAIPMSAQAVPFIFNLQTSDFQQLRVQGQLTFRAADPAKLAELLNFTLNEEGKDYVSDDPVNLGDRVVQAAQGIVQEQIQTMKLRETLTMLRSLDASLKQALTDNAPLKQLGIEVIDAMLVALTPTPETAKALEAEAREAILKEADDAIYDRRKSAVEQERTIQEAELQTDMAMQTKRQEIAEAKIDNERALTRKRAEAKAEQLAADIEAEEQRKALVERAQINRRIEADAEAYRVEVNTKAASSVPVEYIKALAMNNMQPSQLLAVAMGSFAENADKIGTLHIGPDTLSNLMAKHD